MVEINREHIHLREIESLEKQLAEKKAEFGEIKPSFEEKEIELTKENSLEKVQASLQSQQTATDNDGKEKEKHIQKTTVELRSLDTSGQVKRLVVIAFEKGISHSIKIARNLNDAYLLDVLHDKLVGELHDELVQKGKLKDL